MPVKKGAYFVFQAAQPNNSTHVTVKKGVGGANFHGKTGIRKRMPFVL